MAKIIFDDDSMVLCETEWLQLQSLLNAICKRTGGKIKTKGLFIDGKLKGDY